MKNFVYSGETLNALLAAAAVSGEPFLYGSMLVVPQVSGGIGDTITVRTKGVYTIAKTAPLVIAAGAILYWDDATKKVTTSSNTGANLKVGYAAVAGLSADTTIEVLLHY